MSERLPIRSRAHVLENAPDGESGWRMRLRVPEWPGCDPGQFIMLSAGALTSVERTDPLLPRPMAVYRVGEGDQAGELEVLYKRAGRGTALLSETLVGQQVGIVGPLGRPFPPSSGGPALLVGGGTGIASLYLLAAREMAARDDDGGQVIVLLGSARQADLLGEADFRKLGVTLRMATEDGSAGEKGLVTELLAAELERCGDGATVYVCGPTRMMKRCAEMAAARRLPCIVSLENNMACGFGVCLGCAAPLREGGYALVCRRGPVFEASEVEWGGLP